MKNWAGSGESDAFWPALKDAYMRDNGYGIQTRETRNVFEAAAALKDGCDVEIFPADKPFLAAAVTSMDMWFNNTAAQGGGWINTSFDWEPGKPGGQTPFHTFGYYIPFPGEPYGTLKSSYGKEPLNFVIECPKPATPTWQSSDTYGDNFGPVKPSAVALASGAAVAVAFPTTSSGHPQVDVASLAGQFMLPSNSVPAAPDDTRNQGPTSKIAELQDHRVAVVMADETPFDEKLQCITSTDPSCTAFNPAVTIDAGAYIWDLDAMVDPVSGKLLVCFLHNTDPCVSQSTDAGCSAFIPTAHIQPFSYGLHCATVEDGAGGNCCMWEGSGLVECANDVDFATGACANSTLYQVGTAPDDNCNLSGLWNPDSNEYDLCYSNGTNLLFCYSADGQTWSQNDFYTEAQPVTAVKLARVAFPTAGTRVPAICCYEGLTLALQYAQNPTGHATFGSRLIADNYTDLPAGSGVDMFPSPIDGTPVILAQSADVFRGYATYWWEP